MALFWPQIASIVYRNFFMNRSVFHCLYLLLGVILINFFKLNFPVFLTSVVLVMLMGLLQQYYFTFSMVEDRASGFRSTFKIMGLTKSSYFVGQLLSFILTSLGLMVVLIVACLVQQIMDDSASTTQQLNIFFFTSCVYMLALCSQSMLISYAFSKSEAARGVSVAIFVGLVTLGFRSIFSKTVDPLKYINPNYFYIEFFIFVTTRKLVEIPLEPLLYLSLQALFYMLFALYFENVLSSGTDDHGKPWLFFLRRKTSLGEPKSRLTDIPTDDTHQMKLRNVSKVFGHFAALKSIDLDLNLGQIHCILGHNGAGKSTLINVLTGIYKATSGTMEYKGHDLIRLFQEENLALKVGICQAENVLFDQLTVYQHFKMMTMIRRVMDREGAIDNVIRKLHLQGYRDYRVRELSGGNKRKVNLGMALIGNPAILFFDEPTSALDPISRKEIWQILLDIKAESSDKLVLMTTHHLEEAEVVADNIIFLADGTVMVQGKIDDLKKVFGIGYLIQVTSTVDFGSVVFQCLVDKAQESLPTYQFKKSNIEITNRKMEIRIPLSQVSRVGEIVEALRANFPPGLLIVLSTNTLERAYLEIEQRAHRAADPVSTSTETLYPIMDLLYADRELSGPSFLRALGLLIHNKLRYLTQNTVEFIKVIGQYVFICLVISSVFITMNKEDRLLDLMALRGMFVSLLSIELLVSTFGVHNLVYENVRSIKHTLLSHQISPVCYYLAKLLGDLATSLLIYSFIFPLVFLALEARLQQAATVDKFFDLTVMFSMWRFAYSAGGLLFYRLFNSPKLVTVAYPAFYLALVSFNILVALIVAHDQAFYFNELLYFITLPEAEYDNRLGHVLYGLGISSVYFTLTVLIDFWHLKYNYWSKLTAVPDSEASVSSLDVPLMAPQTANLQSVPMDSPAHRTVAKEAEETCDPRGKKIRACGLAKRYSHKTLALKSVTFNVPQGINFGLIGPNGAGKSTLFNIILGRCQKTAGGLEVQGSGVFGNLWEFLVGKSPYSGNNFGVAFQTETIWDDLTVADNLGFYATLHNINPRALSKLLVYFEFEHFLNRTARDLSSGNKRKLCIITSLMACPNIALYDEATTGVDLTMRLKLKKLFEYLREKNRLSSIFTTHFLKDVEIFCEKIGIIADGQFLFVDFIENIRADFGGYMIDLRLDDLGRLEGISRRLESLCEVTLAVRQENEGRATFKATKINDVFELFLFFYDLERQGEISEFAFHQMSIEDIYVGVFKHQSDR